MGRGSRVTVSSVGVRVRVRVRVRWEGAHVSPITVP